MTVAKSSLAAQHTSSPIAAPERDERDAIIERLERTLADERQTSTELREAADALRFKAEILEKSYAKQLADARERATTAEQTLAQQRADSGELGKDHEETIRLLKAARAELAAVKLDREQLRQQLASRSLSAERTPRRDDAVGDGGGTINQLIANADWTRKRAGASAGRSHLEARIEAEQDAPPGDMLAPELVFTKEKERDD